MIVRQFRLLEVAEAVLGINRWKQLSWPGGRRRLRWKQLLEAAGVRDARLHDARHTAATVLLELGVPDRAAMQIMGWSNAALTQRYQHVTGHVLGSVA
ncbi:MAG: tyrosine-type recombinase/integrase, partial [Pseudonocardiaceae bacterium]